MNLSTRLFVLYSVALGLAVELSFSIPLSLLTGYETIGNCFSPAPEAVIPKVGFFIIQTSLFCVLLPFSGWVSDVVVGRRRSVGASLWSCWFGALLQCTSLCVQYGTCGIPVNLAKYGLSGIAYVFLMVGNSGLFTNLPTFGVDQLFDKPHTESQAFIHWSVWGIYLGFSVGYIGFVQKVIYYSLLTQMTGLAIFLFLTMALCLHIFLQDSYETVERSAKDPYKLSYLILKYAWYNNASSSRSALTYWEDEIPSRIDLAKSCYGGPFVAEEVENTKTLVRMMVVFFGTIGFLVPSYHTLVGALDYVNQFQGATTSVYGLGSFLLWKLCDSSVVVFVPVLQLVILPLYPKLEYFIGNPLRGLTLCFFLQIVALICMAFLELFGLSNPSAVNKISFLYFSVPLLFSGLSDSLQIIFGLEFICSQAPSSMAGMLTGLFWCLRDLYMDIGALFSLITFTDLYNVSYKFWICVVHLFICVCGLIAFTGIVRWYKDRRKDDHYHMQAHVESIYDRNLMKAEIAERSISVQYNTFNT